jgi:large subunit ribosomal protein L13
MMKTFSPRPPDIDRKWYVVDADGAVLGRLAAHVATILRGKHKPIFAPHADTGDHVIVVNAKGIRVTGNKQESKIYYRHSGYPGGLRTIPFSKLLSDRPAVIVEQAVRGMLPKNRLGREIFRKLSVYEGADHPHKAQSPVPLSLGEIPRWEGLPQPQEMLSPTAVREPAIRGRTARRTSPGGGDPEASRRRTPGRRTAEPASARTGRAGTGRSTRAPAAKTASRKSTGRKTATRGAAEGTGTRSRRSSDTPRARAAGGRAGTGTSRAKSSSATRAEKSGRIGRRSKKES